MSSRSIKKTGERSFTINNAYHVDGCPTKFSRKDYTGRFIANSAQRAASKALSALCRVKRIRGQCTLYIEMRETTQGFSGKLSAYHCKRIHLKTPIVLPNGITKHYINKVKPANIPSEKCKKSHKSSGRLSKRHPSSHKSGSHKSSRISSSKKSATKKSKSLTKKVSNTVKSTVASIRKSIKNVI